MHPDAEFVAVLAEAPRNVGAEPLLDVLQDLVVARFETHQQQARPLSFITFSVLYGTLALALQLHVMPEGAHAAAISPRAEDSTYR